LIGPICPICEILRNFRKILDFLVNLLKFRILIFPDVLFRTIAPSFLLYQDITSHCVPPHLSNPTRTPPATPHSFIHISKYFYHVHETYELPFFQPDSNSGVNRFFLPREYSLVLCRFFPFVFCFFLPSSPRHVHALIQWRFDLVFFKCPSR
jgi:hypothetical protein